MALEPYIRPPSILHPNRHILPHKAAYFGNTAENKLVSVHNLPIFCLHSLGGYVSVVLVQQLPPLVGVIELRPALYSDFGFVRPHILAL